MLNSRLVMGDNLFDKRAVMDRLVRIAVIKRYGNSDGKTQANQSLIPSMHAYEKFPPTDKISEKAIRKIKSKNSFAVSNFFVIIYCIIT